MARSPGLIEVVRRDHKILVMGPSLLPAFLHTINVGYMTMALERNAAEIGETLSAVRVKECGVSCCPGWTKSVIARIGSRRA